MFTVSRSDNTSHDYGHAGMSAVMRKVFYSSHKELDDSMDEWQDEFFDILPRVDTEMYVKSTVFTQFA